MPSDRIQRQIDFLLNEAEQGIRDRNWGLTRDRSNDVLALDPDNADAQSYLSAAERALSLAQPSGPTDLAADKSASQPPTPAVPALPASADHSPLPASSGPSSPLPEAFASGRYQVRKMLGEGGKKKVYLAHDSVLDRDVAFALIKTGALDETALTRIQREAQAMAKLGDHPNIASVYDYGEHEGQPYMVAPLLSGGDVEGLIKKAPDHKLPIDKTIEITKSVYKGLEFAHAKGIIQRDIKSARHGEW